MKRSYALLILFIISVSHNVYAEQKIFQSSEQQVVLVELYTSQGCSSCPPAERYLNELVSHPQLWKTFIPLAFHVDYWDYIGWKDVFSKNQYTQRQRSYARVRGTRTIYTPGIFINGYTSSAWRRGVDIQPSKQRPGILTVTVNDESIDASFESSNKANKKLVYNIAYIGMNLETKITNGENDGRTLLQNFVVLKHVTIESGNWTTKKHKTIDGFPVTGIVAWISYQGDPTPVQSTGGYL